MLAPRPLHILLVEDHPDTAYITVRLLKLSGFTVDHAAGCLEARKAAQSKKFDLVICDLGLGDGDACELFTELKAEYGIKGIVYTGSDTSEDVQRTKAAGFDKHLVKPVPFPTLLSVIRETVMMPPASFSEHSSSPTSDFSVP